MTLGLSITCPRCHRMSHNENDVINKYCGNCNLFHSERDSQYYFTITPKNEKPTNEPKR